MPDLFFLRVATQEHVVPLAAKWMALPIKRLWETPAVMNAYALPHDFDSLSAPTGSARWHCMVPPNAVALPLVAQARYVAQLSAHAPEMNPSSMDSKIATDERFTWSAPLRLLAD
jgi:hypothetical protein